ncbi:MAG: FecR domain-containing protein [Candidatus Tectomicrobia bacterium]|uniref:FecR domain-containing protein n=1 Tax=Tectimicrobiota bacterium TaxID=2528274 RepID=A0A932FZE9_UNCTE|nr:FecR domain-containing protein [Candidatus Tectomicrobia bacterium]
MRREQRSRRERGIFSLLFFLLLLWPVFAGAQPDPEPIGSIMALEGEVLVFHRGQTRWVRARLRDKVFLHDTIQTRERAKAQILFQDDSLLTLSESTRVEVSEHLYQPAENQRSSVFQLFTGKVRAVVGKAFTREGSRFQVHTPTAVVGTRMTQFIVWVVSPDLTIVITLEGEVVTRNIVETVMGEAIVREGFMSQIEINLPPAEPVPAPSEQMDQLLRDTRVPKAALSFKAEAPAAQEGKGSSADKVPEGKTGEGTPAATPGTSAGAGASGGAAAGGAASGTGSSGAGGEAPGTSGGKTETPETKVETPEVKVETPGAEVTLPPLTEITAPPVDEGPGVPPALSDLMPQLPTLSDTFSGDSFQSLVPDTLGGSEPSLVSNPVQQSGEGNDQKLPEPPGLPGRPGPR